MTKLLDGFDETDPTAQQSKEADRQAGRERPGGERIIRVRQVWRYLSYMSVGVADADGAEDALEVPPHDREHGGKEKRVVPTGDVIRQDEEPGTAGNQPKGDKFKTRQVSYSKSRGFSSADLRETNKTTRCNSTKES